MIIKHTSIAQNLEPVNFSNKGRVVWDDGMGPNRYVQMKMSTGQHPIYYFHRKTCGGVDAVPILEYTKPDGTVGRKLAFLRNKRAAINEEHGMTVDSIEFPGGLAGDEQGRQGESSEQAIRSEVLEEGGYRAKQVSSYSDRVAIMPSGSSSVVGLFKVMLGKKDDSQRTTDHGTIREVIEVDEDQAWDFLKEEEAKGNVVSAMTYAGMAHLLHENVQSMIIRGVTKVTEALNIKDPQIITRALHSIGIKLQ